MVEVFFRFFIHGTRRYIKVRVGLTYVFFFQSGTITKERARKENEGKKSMKNNFQHTIQG